MGKITIRTPGDATAPDTAAVSVGPQLPEQSEHALEHLPEEPQATAAAVPGGIHVRGRDGTPERARFRPVPRVKTVRRALGLTQEEFAARYGIPVGTLRDWEQGRTEPDQPARAYIRVIASNPEWVFQVLAAEP